MKTDTQPTTSAAYPLLDSQQNPLHRPRYRPRLAQLRRHWRRTGAPPINGVLGQGLHVADRILK